MKRPLSLEKTLGQVTASSESLACVLRAAQKYVSVLWSMLVCEA